MGLPRLKDFLPPEAEVEELPLPVEAADHADAIARVAANLDLMEARLMRVEVHTAALREALDAFVERLSSEPGLSVEDVEAADADLYEETQSNVPVYEDHLKQSRQRRAKMLRGARATGALRSRAEAVYARESQALRDTLSVFKEAHLKLAKLRDKLLVQEAQLFSHAAFWEDDED